MGLVLAMREGDGITLTLPDGTVITIIHTERCRPAQGVKLRLEAPMEIKIGRIKREDGNR